MRLSSDNARPLANCSTAGTLSCAAKHPPSPLPVAPPRPLTAQQTMLLKHVSTLSATTRPVPTSCTCPRLSPLQKSRCGRFQARNLNLSHSRRPVFSAIHPLLLSKTHPMASFGYSSSSSTTSSVASTPAGTASPSPSSSISSLASMRMSPANKRVSLSSRNNLGGINTALGDTTALENSFKAASLDSMRGYSQNAYAVVEQTHETESIPRPRARGYQLLREPAWNKGRASMLVSVHESVADVLI